MDPISRITIPEIIEHPWYNLELPERYQAVLDRLAEEQSELDQWLASCKIDQALVDEREQLLKLMVKEAGKQVTDRSMGTVGALQIVDYQREDIKHINLTHAAIEEGSPGIEVCMEAMRDFCGSFFLPSGLMARVSPRRQRRRQRWRRGGSWSACTRFESPSTMAPSSPRQMNSQVPSLDHWFFHVACNYGIQSE